VLGPLIDNNLRRGMIMTDGNFVAMLTRPGTLVILGVALVFLVLPFAIRLYGRARGRTDLAMLTETEVG
jgi:putative tricarboxylic transport membrane protein